LWVGFQNSPPAPCVWAAPVEEGTLDSKIDESSGLAISRRIPNRSYRINDSGDDGRFFLMDLTGGNARSVAVTGFDPRDTEDMALGPCDAKTDCLFIGDIGDNDRRRATVEVAVVEELRDFPSAVLPRHRVRLRYPDGPHDAEALGVHPNGSLYIVTKDTPRAQIFRLRRNQWARTDNSVQTLELLTTIDLATLLPVSTVIDRRATSMDIARDGKKVLILTYRNALELLLDLSAPVPNPSTWKEGQQYRQVSLEVLEQQEAIAYLPDGKAFLYDTERAIRSRPARIMRVSCRN